MEGRTVRGFYDNGELRFAQPVDVEGCWNLEITFVEQVDEESIPLDADPHRPRHLKPFPDRLEEAHRTLEDQRPNIGPR
jgi:hypothetical protein